MPLWVQVRTKTSTPHGNLYLMRWLFIIMIVIVFSGNANPAERFSARDLVFLTQGGCVNTTRMRASLNEALGSLGLPKDYTLIEVDKLSASDRRRGYGTPTVLYRNKDIFGLVEPNSKDTAPS